MFEKLLSPEDNLDEIRRYAYSLYSIVLCADERLDESVSLAPLLKPLSDGLWEFYKHEYENRLPVKSIEDAETVPLKSPIGSEIYKTYSELSNLAGGLEEHPKEVIFNSVRRLKDLLG